MGCEGAARRGRALALAGLLAGCSRPAATEARPPSPALRPAANAASAIPLFAFGRTEQRPAVIFARTADPLAHHPILLVLGEAGWARVELDAEEFQQRTWVHAAAMRDGPELWGVADTDVESPGAALFIVRSPDGGRTQQRVAIRKPSYLAQFRALRMSAAGSGAIVVHLDDDAGDGVAAGDYTSVTVDRGATWAPWRHEPDSLIAPDILDSPDPATAPPLQAIQRQLEAP